MNREIVEIFVSQAQLMNRLQDDTQDGFLILQHHHGQPLQHQGNVEQKNRILRRNATGLEQSHFRFLKLTGTEVRTRQILHHVNVVVLVELLQTVFVHLNRTDVLLLFDVDMRNVQPHVAKVGRRFTDLRNEKRR